MATVGCLAWLLLVRNSEDRLVAGTALAVFALATLAAWPLRRRLTADQHGFIVRSAAGSRSFAWFQVLSVTAPTRRRRGLASTALEIDLADDGLVVLGKLELGADPAEVAQVMAQYSHLP